MSRLDLRTRRQIRVLNAQEWTDFKLHWPMEVFHFLADVFGGFIFGVALALAVFIQFLKALP